jgi:protein-tyrosine-phosphatase
VPAFDAVTQRRLDDLVAQIVGEFEGRFDQGTVARLMVDSATRLSRTSAIPDYVLPLAYRLTKERLRATARGEEPETGDAKAIVFVSLSGGGRGQLAAALTTRLAGEQVAVYSAGTHAGGTIDPAVATALGEIGVDPAEEFARPITPEVLAGVDLVVTMGHSVGVFDVPPGTAVEDWRIGDPVGAPLEEVRRVRDDVERRVRQLLDRLGVGVTEAAGSRPPRPSAPA